MDFICAKLMDATFSHIFMGLLIVSAFIFSVVGFLKPVIYIEFIRSCCNSRDKLGLPHYPGEEIDIKDIENDIPLARFQCLIGIFLFGFMCYQSFTIIIYQKTIWG